jgi:hypothetical protein
VPSGVHDVFLDTEPKDGKTHNVSKRAFIDETFRDPGTADSGYYQLTAVIIDTVDAGAMRTAVRGVLPGEIFHTSALANAGQHAAVDRMLTTVAAEPCWNLITVTAGHLLKSEQEDARQRCMAEMLRRINQHKITHVVADSREANVGRDPHVRNRLDQATLRSLRETGEVNRHMTLAHLHDWAEPLLWVPDAVGWAYRQHRLRDNPYFWQQVSAVTTVHEV